MNNEYTLFVVYLPQAIVFRFPIFSEFFFSGWDIDFLNSEGPEASRCTSIVAVGGHWFGSASGTLAYPRRSVFCMPRDMFQGRRRVA